MHGRNSSLMVMALASAALGSLSSRDYARTGVNHYTVEGGFGTPIWLPHWPRPESGWGGIEHRNQRQRRKRQRIHRSHNPKRGNGRCK